MPQWQATRNTNWRIETKKIHTKNSRRRKKSCIKEWNAQYQMISFEKFFKWYNNLFTPYPCFFFSVSLSPSRQKPQASVFLFNIFWILNATLQVRIYCLKWCSYSYIWNAYKCHHLNFYGNVFACIRFVVWMLCSHTLSCQLHIWLLSLSLSLLSHGIIWHPARARVRLHEVWLQMNKSRNKIKQQQ